MMMTNSRALKTALRSRLSESLCNKSVNVVPQIYLHCAMPTAIFSYAEERFPRALFSLSQLNANIKGIFFLSIVVVFVLFFFLNFCFFSPKTWRIDVVVVVVVHLLDSQKGREENSMYIPALGPYMMDHRLAKQKPCSSSSFFLLPFSFSFGDCFFLLLLRSSFIH